MAQVVGIPREHRPFEFRVGMLPKGVSMLTQMGHQVYVETGAGLGCGFPDTAYEQAGARIAYSKDEVFRRANLLLKIQRPTEEEVSWMAEGQVALAFMMMANVPKNRLRVLEEKNITTIAYELIEEDDGSLPVLFPLSEIGGRMTAQIAAQYLQNDRGGTGTLLGGIVGVPPSDVVIVGAGVVGMSAAEAFIGMGANVILMDIDLNKLRLAHDRFNGRVTTMVAYRFNLEKVCKFADVLVSAVQIPGQHAPLVITRQMIQSMHKGALVIDMSIDQGGSVETSRLTFHDQPTFEVDQVIHYCVPNVPSVVARTATHAFLNAAWQYIRLIAQEGIEVALAKSPALRRGVVTHRKELRQAV
jgi:alanine dehydrogenase